MGNQENSFAINTHCNQDWSSMEISNAGRYCQVCNKNVIDFTNQSNVDIYKTIMDSQERICGRIWENQLTLSKNLRNDDSKKIITGDIIICPHG
jgi:predicted PP-loop superfamily ATPase